MKPLEVYEILTEVQKDYAGMVRELNAHKRMVKPVDPWGLPLMQKLQTARRDLAMVAGLDLKREGLSK